MVIIPAQSFSSATVFFRIPSLVLVVISSIDSKSQLNTVYYDSSILVVDVMKFISWVTINS